MERNDLIDALRAVDNINDVDLVQYGKEGARLFFGVVLNDFPVEDVIEVIIFGKLANAVQHGIIDEAALEYIRDNTTHQFVSEAADQELLNKGAYGCRWCIEHNDAVGRGDVPGTVAAPLAPEPCPLHS